MEKELEKKLAVARELGAVAQLDSIKSYLKSMLADSNVEPTQLELERLAVIVDLIDIVDLRLVNIKQRLAQKYHVHVAVQICEVS